MTDIGITIASHVIGGRKRMRCLEAALSRRIRTHGAGGKGGDASILFYT